MNMHIIPLNPTNLLPCFRIGERCDSALFHVVLSLWTNTYVNVPLLVNPARHLHFKTVLMLQNSRRATLHLEASREPLRALSLLSALDKGIS